MKNDRLFAIVYLLLSHEKLTARYLADYFEVSTKTIYRDIDTLTKANIPIYMSKGKNGGIALLDYYTLDKTLLTIDEKIQLASSLQVMEQIHTMQPEIYRKLAKYLGYHQESYFNIDLSSWNSKVNFAFQHLQQALLLHHKIQFIYSNSSGKTDKRVVEPYKIYFKYNQWYFYGYDIDKKGFRLFKLSRMHEVQVLDESFVDRPFEDYQFNSNEQEQIKLKLEISQRCAYRVYDDFCLDQITQDEQGNFIIEVKYPYNDWIYSFLLSYGDQLKVLEPQFIQDELVQRLQNNLKIYLK